MLLLSDKGKDDNSSSLFVAIILINYTG